MNAARRLTLTALASLCALGGGLALTAPALARDVHVFSSTFGEEGSGNGQFMKPDGVAVNETTHNVYVVDSGNNRVEEFTSAGAYVGQFDGSGAPTGVFAGPTQIAVDNSGDPLDPSAGDVYVIDRSHEVIDKFSAEGSYLGQISGGEGGAGFGRSPEGLTVDPTGVVWVFAAKMYRYSDAAVNAFLSENGLPVGNVDGFQVSTSVDSNGRLYVARREGIVQINGSTFESETEFDFFKSNEEASRNAVTGLAVDTSTSEIYTPSGDEVRVFQQNSTPEEPPVERFGIGNLVDTAGVAVDASNHAAFIVDTDADRVAVFDQIVVPDVSTGEPTESEHEGSVTLNGTVDPDGEPVTSCLFEYGTEESYGSTVPCEPAPGSGSNPVAVHAEVSGLALLTGYHYRLVAGNAGGSNAGIDETFFESARPSIDGESIAGVVSDAATLQARVNPGGSDTSYRFEYGPTTSYGQSLPVPDGDAGSGISDVALGVRLQGLRPDTVYHFRLVVGNGVQREVTGTDQEFTTQVAGGEFTQPDGRVWELVSPPNKQGADINAVGREGGGDIQASEDGGAITYGATAPFVVNPAGSRAPEVTQVFSTRRAPGSWGTADITTPHTEGGTELAVGHSAEYKLFSGDLSLGLVEPEGDTPLPPLPAGSEKTIYLREANGEYKALVTSANVPAGTKFGGGGEDGGAVEFVGANPNFSEVFIASGVGLTAGTNGGLYAWAEGQLQYVGHFGLAGVKGAISKDGSRVVLAGEGKTYLRDMVSGETVEVGAGAYATASSDDSRVFFTEGGDLHVFEVTSGKGKPLAGGATDLTVDGNVGESASVRGVLGAGEDGSDVYFVAAGVLGDGAEHGAEPGGNNLYVEHYDEGTKAWTSPTFIAALAGGDGPSWDEGELDRTTSRVSPNGLYLAFMSERSLTGYENHDANSGVPDEEVFLYDATGAGRLVCASCNPTGAQPVGLLVGHEYDERLVNNTSDLWWNRWLAGNIPGWTTESLSRALYQSRYLSNSGRLFFDSNDALVPADVNGKEDVYEYEPAGVGSCQPPGYGQSASVVFSEGVDGCVALISAGTSSEESAFMDASETGGDVFFLTLSKLVPQDYDTSLDLYDAHQCAASAPCAPTVGLVPPPCTTGDACKAAPTPQPAVFAAPSSETFSGAGNVVPSASESMVTTRSSTQARKLAKALKACAKKPKRKRAACERQARGRYAKAAGKRVGKSNRYSERGGSDVPAIASGHPDGGGPVSCRAAGGARRGELGIC
jgi:hypothetical protein